MENYHVGLEIKKLREERKLSKSRLAREAGFSDAYLVQIEKGDRTPSYSVLVALAKALRVATHRLLIPAGLYNASTVDTAEAHAAERVADMEDQLGRTLTEAEQDRVLSVALDRAVRDENEDAFYADAEARDAAFIDMLREDDPLALTDEAFWGWDRKSPWAPEHWNTLSDKDRKLVQQLINRLVQLADE